VDAERLAAYLAGELDADETAAVEAALARDPAVRASLEALQRADAALASLPATELPAGFERRLRAAIDEELATQLRPADAPATADARTSARPHGEPARDELASRRARRTPRWMPALAGAAAAVAVIAGAVVGVGVLGGGGDDADTGTGTMMTLEADDADGAEAADVLPGPGELPTLVVGDRELDDDLADELLASAELQAVAQRGLEPAEGRSLGDSWRRAFAGFTAVQSQTESGLSDDAAAADRPDAAEDTDEEAAASEDLSALERSGGVRVLADGPLSEADNEAVDRCLTEVLSGGDAIPAYLELATYDGEPAVVIGLVTFDPASGTFSRPEVWILDRQDCQVRRFSQG
jgi:anti-sigma factor RsiW